MAKEYRSPTLVYDVSNPLKVHFVYKTDKELWDDREKEIPVDPKLIGKRLKEIREDAGLTIKDMAAYLTEHGYEISNTWYSKVEAGLLSQRSLSTSKLAQLGKILGIPPSYFYVKNKMPPVKLRLKKRPAVHTHPAVPFICTVEFPATQERFAYILLAHNERQAKTLIRGHYQQDDQRLRWVSVSRLSTEPQLIARIRRDEASYVEYFSTTDTPAESGTE